MKMPDVVHFEDLVSEYHGNSVMEKVYKKIINGIEFRCILYSTIKENGDWSEWHPLYFQKGREVNKFTDFQKLMESLPEMKIV